MYKKKLGLYSLFALLLGGFYWFYFFDFDGHSAPLATHSLEKVSADEAKPASSVPVSTSEMPPSANQPIVAISTPPVVVTPPQPDKSVFEDIQSILDEGVLKVAILQEDRIPFFFVDKNGKLSGVDVELAELIAKSLGVRVEFIRTAPDFNTVVDQVSKGEAHMAASKLSYTDSRAKKVIYSDPYMTLNMALLINRSKLGSLPPDVSVNGIFDHHKVSLGMQKGSSQVAVVQKMFPKAGLIQLDTLDEVNRQVLSGECFARVSDTSELTKLLIQKPEYNIRCMIVALKGSEDNLHFVVNKSFPSLARQIKLLSKNKPEFHLDFESVFRKFENNIREETSKK